MVRRKVTCVFGVFDDKQDFVLEPCCSDTCECDICKDAFWIEGSQTIQEVHNDAIGRP